MPAPAKHRVVPDGRHPEAVNVHHSSAVRILRAPEVPDFQSKTFAWKLGQDFKHWRKEHINVRNIGPFSWLLQRGLNPFYWPFAILNTPPRLYRKWVTWNDMKRRAKIAGSTHVNPEALARVMPSFVLSRLNGYPGGELRDAGEVRAMMQQQTTAFSAALESLERRKKAAGDPKKIDPRDNPENLEKFGYPFKDFLTEEQVGSLNRVLLERNQLAGNIFSLNRAIQAKGLTPEYRKATEELIKRSIELDKEMLEGDFYDFMGKMELQALAVSRFTNDYKTFAKLYADSTKKEVVGAGESAPGEIVEKLKQQQK